MLGLGFVLLISDFGVALISIIYGLCFWNVKPVIYTCMAITIILLGLGMSYLFLMGGFTKKEVVKRDFILMYSLPRDDIIVNRNEGKISEICIGNDTYKNVVSEKDNPTSLTLNKTLVRERCLNLTWESKEEYEVILS